MFGTKLPPTHDIDLATKKENMEGNGRKRICCGYEAILWPRKETSGGNSFLLNLQLCEPIFCSPGWNEALWIQSNFAHEHNTVPPAWTQAKTS